MAINELTPLGIYWIAVAPTRIVINRYDTVSKVGIQEGQLCMVGQLQLMGKSPEDKMDRSRRSRVERSLWRDLRLDWIPAFTGMTL